MKKIVSLIIALAIVALSIFTLASCGKTTKIIAIPNDTTNEARALELLESLGLIKLKSGLDTTATVLDIVENPYGLEFREVEAAQISLFNIEGNVESAETSQKTDE